MGRTEGSGGEHDIAASASAQKAMADIPVRGALPAADAENATVGLRIAMWCRADDGRPGSHVRSDTGRDLSDGEAGLKRRRLPQRWAPPRKQLWRRFCPGHDSFRAAGTKTPGGRRRPPSPGLHFRHTERARDASPPVARQALRGIGYPITLPDRFLRYCDLCAKAKAHQYPGLARNGRRLRRTGKPH